MRLVLKAQMRMEATSPAIPRTLPRQTTAKSILSGAESVVPTVVKDQFNSFVTAITAPVETLADERSDDEDDASNKDRDKIEADPEDLGITPEFKEVVLYLCQHPLTWEEFPREQIIDFGARSRGEGASGKSPQMRRPFALHQNQEPRASGRRSSDFASAVGTSRSLESPSSARERRSLDSHSRRGGSELTATIVGSVYAGRMSKSLDMADSHNMLASSRSNICADEGSAPAKAGTSVEDEPSDFPAFLRNDPAVKTLTPAARRSSAGVAVGDRPLGRSADTADAPRSAVRTSEAGGDASRAESTDANGGDIARDSADAAAANNREEHSVGG
eukprot:TRINITY_DN23819_c0_g1_i1.p1 TRINITY_DN23819_c0_g1~~TRINITY_DN23819_c0_g1_i1.p1  ORF type:complete len:332 (-),score=92.32 TRINITY_DN23819_c0_g1_i1:10-1005(-)